MPSSSLILAIFLVNMVKLFFHLDDAMDLPLVRDLRSKLFLQSRSSLPLEMTFNFGVPGGELVRLLKTLFRNLAHWSSSTCVPRNFDRPLETKLKSQRGGFSMSTWWWRMRTKMVVRRDKVEKNKTKEMYTAENIINSSKQIRITVQFLNLFFYNI